MASDISTTVADGLMRDLQADVDNLRAENRELTSNLIELKQRHEREKAEAAAKLASQAEEIEQLQLMHSKEQTKLQREGTLLERKLLAAQKDANGQAPIVEAGAELERELVNALTECLGGADWEGTAGAARRRAGKSSSAIVNAAVRTAKRAQATWASEHSKLRDEALAATRLASERLVELDEAHATIRRLRNELNQSRRKGSSGHGDAGERERLQQEERWRIEAAVADAVAAEREAAAMAAKASQALAPPHSFPPKQSSAFTAYVEARREVQQRPPLQNNNHNNTLSRKPSDASRQLPRLHPTRTLPQQPAADDNANSNGNRGRETASSSTDSAALRSMGHMQDELQRRWKSHVRETKSMGRQIEHALGAPQKPLPRSPAYTDVGWSYKS